MAEHRMLYRIRPAGAATSLRSLIAIMNDDISNIRNPGECVCENENRIPPPNAIEQKKNGTDQTQPPKRNGNRDLLSLFRGNPLHEKAGEENSIADPPDRLPHVPLDSEETLAVPDEARHGHLFFREQFLHFAGQRFTSVEVSQFSPLVHQPNRRDGTDLKRLAKLVLPAQPIEILRPR